MTKSLLKAATGVSIGVGLLLIGAIPASASTAGFDFAECSTSSNHYGIVQTENSSCGSAGYSNTSNSFSQTIGTGTSAITVTATAYVTATNSSAVGTNLTSGTNAVVGQYTGNGIGVCSTGDSGYSTSHSGNGCSAPTHQMDDSGDYEFILFTFSTPVNLGSITLANYGPNDTHGNPQDLNDLGFTYWVNPSSEAKIIAGGTTVLCGTSGAATCPTVEGNGTDIGTGSWTSGFGSNGLTSTTQLLVAADLNETDDYFKIQGLVVSQAGTGVLPSVPEPGTFGMIGLALVGLGMYQRKRKTDSQK